MEDPTVDPNAPTMPEESGDVVEEAPAAEETEAPAEDETEAPAEGEEAPKPEDPQ